MRVLVERRDSLGKAGWLDALGADDAEWLGLIERGVLEPIAGERFRLTFVGMISLPTELVVVFPKYASGAPKASEFTVLHRTLSHYLRRLGSRRAVRSEEKSAPMFRDDRAFSEYQLWLTLRDWYREHGPYLRREREVGLTWGRTIDWPRTLGRSVAVHGGDTAVYPAPVMARAARRPNEVTHIQLSVLAHLDAKYRLPGEAPIDPAHCSEYASLLRRLGADQAALALRVQREVGSAFRTDEVAMLSTLLEWLRDTQEGSRGPVIARLFGTTRFEHVWEDACRVVLGNAPERSLPNPFWVIDAGPPLMGEPPRADLWATLPDLRPAVFDAKYYWPLPQSHPGWGDVVKQLFYAEVCDDRADLVNCFLFPDPNAIGIRHRGHVDLRQRPDVAIPRFPAVRVYGVQPDALFASYVSNQVAPTWLDKVAATA